MKYILGKKIAMTQVWQGDKVVPVTKIQAGPCVVVQIKKAVKDGYDAAQIGYGERKEKNIKKPQRNHTRDLGSFAYLKEFKTTGEDLKKGDIIEVDTFIPGDKIKVEGFSKGKGFQGVVKRHGFSGQNKSHGNKDQLRMPGSAGATGPAHVFKGLRMPGRLGNDRVSVKNLEIVEIDKDNNIILIKGAVPGARNGLLLLSGPGDLKIKKIEDKIKPEEKEAAEEPAEAKKEEKEPNEPQENIQGTSKEKKGGEEKKD